MLWEPRAHGKKFYRSPPNGGCKRRRLRWVLDIQPRRSHLQFVWCLQPYFPSCRSFVAFVTTKTYSSPYFPSTFLTACTTRRYAAVSTTSTTPAFRQHRPTISANMPSPRPILHRDVATTIPATACSPTPAACTCLPAPCTSQLSAYSACIHKF